MKMNYGINFHALDQARVNEEWRTTRPLSNEEAGMVQPEPVKKIGVKGIMLDRAEGPTELCISYYVPDFASASRQIIENSKTASRGGAYDKHDFTVIFEDGFKYSGRFDVHHFSYLSDDDLEGFEYCIAQHIKDVQGYILDNPETNDKKHIQQAKEILDTYDLDTGIIDIYEAERLILELVAADELQTATQDDEDQPEMERIWVDVVDVAKMIRKDLKASFPDQKFSVKSDRYAGGSSIRIGWIDGIDAPSVEAIVGHYKGTTFDGMIDLQSSVTEEVDGKLYRYGSDHVMTDREISPEMIERIAKDVAELTGKEMTDVLAISGFDCPQMGYLRWCDIVHRLVHKFNLDNYHGVKERVGCWAGNELEWELY
jgi:hypothetical protein